MPDLLRRTAPLRELRCAMTSYVVQLMLEIPDIPARTAAGLRSLKASIDQWGDDEAHRVAFVLRGAWIEGNEATHDRHTWDTMASVVLAASSVWLFRTDRALTKAEDVHLAKALWNLACVTQSRGQVDVVVEVLASARCPQCTAEVLELYEAAVAALA